MYIICLCMYVYIGVHMGMCIYAYMCIYNTNVYVYICVCTSESRVNFHFLYPIANFHEVHCNAHLMSAKLSVILFCYINVFLAHSHLWYLIYYCCNVLNGPMTGYFLKGEYEFLST